MLQKFIAGVYAVLISSQNALNENSTMNVLFEYEDLKNVFERTVSQVCNETNAQLIISKYKKNTMKKKRRASYKSKKIMCFSLRVLVSN